MNLDTTVKETEENIKLKDVKCKNKGKIYTATGGALHFLSVPSFISSWENCFDVPPDPLKISSNSSLFLYCIL